MVINAPTMLAELWSSPHPTHVVEGAFLEAKIGGGFVNGEEWRLGCVDQFVSPAFLCDAWSVTWLHDLRECRLSMSPFSTPQLSSLK
jgi:hypothetical protein